MSELSGFINVANAYPFFFTNASNNDLLIYPETSNQQVLIGQRSNQNAYFTLSNNIGTVNNLFVSTSNMTASNFSACNVSTGTLTATNIVINTVSATTYSNITTCNLSASNVDGSNVSSCNITVSRMLTSLSNMSASNLTCSNLTASNIRTSNLTVTQLHSSLSNMTASNFSACNISASVVNATTITSTNGSGIQAINAANITSGTLDVARGGTGTTNSTGSGNLVLSTSPTLTGTSLIGGVYVPTNLTVGEPTMAINGSSGDKLVLVQGNGSTYPYSIGINTNTMWYSVPTAATHNFYVNGTEISRINNGGILVTGGVNATNIVSTGDSSVGAKLTVSGNTVIAGDVSIGTTLSRAKLEISGSKPVALGSSYRIYKDSPGFGSLVADTYNLSILADVHIATAQSFIAYSDKRIKKDIETIEVTSAFQSLRPVKYKYIDTPVKTDKVQYGFIAQEVEDLYPELVLTTSDYVPDIYILSESIIENTITISKKHNLKVGDSVKLILEKEGNKMTNVVDIVSEYSFTTELDLSEESIVFVYGKEVNDHKSLIYDNFAPIIIKHVQDLEKENIILKARLDAIEARLSTL